jgi:hypothetical protein
LTLHASKYIFTTVSRTLPRNVDGLPNFPRLLLTYLLHTRYVDVWHYIVHALQSRPPFAFRVNRLLRSSGDNWWCHGSVQCALVPTLYVLKRYCCWWWSSSSTCPTTFICSSCATSSSCIHVYNYRLALMILMNWKIIFVVVQLSSIIGWWKFDKNYVVVFL